MATVVTATQRGFDITEESWSLSELAQVATQIDTTSDVRARFVTAFQRLAGVPGAAMLAPSGRQALRLALSLRGTHPGDQVVVPAYCCEVVGHAIIDAGLRPRLIDSGTEPGSVDVASVLDAVNDAAVCTVILPHLFGLPIDVGDIARACASRGVCLIEDVAQTVDGRTGDTRAGTNGDFAVFSFGLEKPLSLLGGGMLVSNRPEVSPERLHHAAKPMGWHVPTSDEEYQSLIRGHRDIAFLREGIGGQDGVARRLRRSVRRLARATGTRAQRGTLASLGPIRASLGLSLIARYADIRRRRRENDALLRELLRHGGVGDMLTAPLHAESDPLYALLVLPESLVSRLPRLHRDLGRAGFVGARLHAPQTMDGDSRVRSAMRATNDLAYAHRLGRSLVDLPIHERLEADDIGRLAATVVAALR